MYGRAPGSRVPHLNQNATETVQRVWPGFLLDEIVDISGQNAEEGGWRKDLSEYGIFVTSYVL